MAQRVTVDGVGVMNKPGIWWKFAVRDSTQSWFTSAETIKIEAPELFEHIRRKIGHHPTTVRLAMELRILD